MSDAVQPSSVEFYFDVVCPWCWMTSRWAAEVAEARGFEIDWRPISLSVVNEDNENEDHVELHQQGHRAARVATAISEQHDAAAVGRFYAEMGTRRHPDGRDDFDVMTAESLEAAGLPAALAEAADDESFDRTVRATTKHALEIAGPDVGVPVISIDGVAFFGPVVTPAPTGEAALRLWDGIHAAASIDGFFELKRGRSRGPQF